MNNTATWMASVILVTAGLVAEVLLAWVFIRDWRSGRVKQRNHRPHQPHSSAAARPPKSRRRALAGTSLAALGVIACVAAAQAPAAQPENSNSTNIPAPQSGQPDPSAPASTPQPAPTAPDEAVGSAISFQLNLDYTTAYFYRGIIQEDSGLILQPAARLTVNLVDTDSFRLDGFAGAWNSFHGQKTAADTRGDFTEYWYESDLYAGLTATSGKLSLTTSYTFLTSPSDAFETVQELGFTLALDDSEWFKEWSLKPYATLALETGADASDDADSDTGAYLELGIAPGFSFDVGATPITFTFPASVGLSLSDYYQDASGSDDTFGFAQLGAKVSIPLGEPSRFGAWTLYGGVSLLLLGDHTGDYNADDDTHVIGTIGVQWNF